MDNYCCCFIFKIMHIIIQMQISVLLGSTHPSKSQFSPLFLIGSKCLQVLSLQIHFSSLVNICTFFTDLADCPVLVELTLDLVYSHENNSSVTLHDITPHILPFCHVLLKRLTLSLASTSMSLIKLVS